jgi:hypothetical protein
MREAAAVSDLDHKAKNLARFSAGREFHCDLDADAVI